MSRELWSTRPCALVWLKQIFQGCQPNGRQSMISEPRCRPMSSTNIEHIMPAKLAQALANSLFPALDSQLRSGRHIGIDELDNHAFLIVHQEGVVIQFINANVTD